MTWRAPSISPYCLGPARRSLFDTHVMRRGGATSPGSDSESDGDVGDVRMSGRRGGGLFGGGEGGGGGGGGCGVRGDARDRRGGRGVGADSMFEPTFRGGSRGGGDRPGGGAGAAAAGAGAPEKRKGAQRRLPSCSQSSPEEEEEDLISPDSVLSPGDVSNKVVRGTLAMSSPGKQKKMQELAKMHRQQERRAAAQKLGMGRACQMLLAFVS